MSKQSDLVNVAQDAGTSGYVNITGGTMTGTLNVNGVARDTDAIRVGASSSGTGYGLRIGASGATDPLEVWREHSNGNQMQLSVDYFGRVTMPYQPAFNARVSSSGPYSPTLPITVPYSDVSLNVGSHYNASNYRFTAPVAGNYMFYGGFGVWKNGDVRGLEFALSKNGGYYARGEQFIAQAQSNNTHVTCQVSAVIPLAVNDYVEVTWISASDTTNLYQNSRGNFSGFLIG